MSSEKFLTLLSQGHNILLTGPGGTGKTYTLKQALEAYPENFVITSSTGISAVNLHPDARTIHSFSGIGTHNNEDYLTHKKLMYLLHGLPEGCFQAILGTEKLIIDEVSMMCASQITLLDRLFKAVKGNSLPFGGIQMIFSGDFLQLPPVTKSTPENPNPVAMLAFESEAWKEANIKVVQLTEVKRVNNKEFAELLCRVRTMDYTGADFKLLKATENKVFEHTPVKLFNSNRKAEDENNIQLAKIEKPILKIKAKYRGDWDKVKELKKSILALDELNLKEGCRVMIIMNKAQDSLNDHVNYVNGSLGTFLSLETRETARKVWIDDRDPVSFEVIDRRLDYKTYHVLSIQLDSGEHIYLKKNVWKYGEAYLNKEGKEQYEAEYSQYPVRLAYAFTIHKSQGMSIPLIELDATGIRTDNQFYVGVSRTESLEGLKVVGLKAFYIKACQKALEFYKQSF